MKKISYIKYMWLIGLSCSLFACSDMSSNYQAYVKDGEIVYTGKADSVSVYPGKNRIKLSWLLVSDPKVNLCRVFWNQGKDSVEVKVENSAGVDTVSTLLKDMEEGTYSFQIVTYDNEGNSSIKVSKTGKVYGSIYENSLLNRPIESVKWQPGGSTYLEWGNAESSAIGVKVTYTNNSGMKQSMMISPDEVTTELANFKSTADVEYQTMYLPDSMAIDTFYAEQETAKVNEIFLANSGFPVEHGDWDGDRWGTPKDWMVNDSVKIHDGYGGFDGYHGGGYFSMESWGSQPDIINGKIYKLVTLPAGEYSYEASFTDDDVDGSEFVVQDSDTAYVVVAQGNTLPDVSDVESMAMGYMPFDDRTKVEFTLNQETEISLGFVASFGDGSQSFRCPWIRLYKLQ